MTGDLILIATIDTAFHPDSFIWDQTVSPDSFVSLCLGFFCLELPDIFNLISSAHCKRCKSIMSVWIQFDWFQVKHGPRQLFSSLSGKIYQALIHFFQKKIENFRHDYSRTLCFDIEKIKAVKGFQIFWETLLQVY